MNINIMLKNIFKYLIVASIAMILMMILNNITQYSFIGFTGLWYELDLRIEGNLATWVESIMMIACAIPAYAGFLLTKELSLKKSFRFFLLIWVLVAIYISADEMLGLHEYITEIFMNTEFTNSENFIYGFNWVFLYAPLAVLLMAFSLYEIRYFFLRFTQRSHKVIWISIMMMGLGIVMVILLEVLEAWLFSKNLSRQVSTLFEEGSELIVIIGFFRLMLGVYTSMEQESTP